MNMQYVDFSPNRTRLGSSNANALPDQPQDPGLTTRTEELLKHLYQLDQELVLMRTALFGPMVSSMGETDKPDDSLADMLATACRKAACMVGEMATINSKIG